MTESDEHCFWKQLSGQVSRRETKSGSLLYLVGALEAYKSMGVKGKLREEEKGKGGGDAWQKKRGK